MTHLDRDSVSHAQAGLRAHQAAIVEALDGVSTICYATGADGMVIWVNRAAVDVIGEDVTGSHFARVIAPEHLEAARRAFESKLVGDEAVTDFELNIVSRDGERIPVAVTSVPLREEGEVVGVLGIAHVTSGGRIESQRTDTGGVRLTPRQSEVLRLLGRGHSTPEIAGVLGISVETTRNHIRGLLRELGAHSRLEAIVRAHQLGILDPLSD